MSTIYAGMPEVEKAFVSMKIVGDNFATDSEYVQASLRSDAGHDWESAGIVGRFDTSPSEKIAITSFVGYSAFTTVYMQIVLQLRTSYPGETPQMKAAVIDLIEHQPVKWSYTWNMFFSDNKETRQGANANTRLETDWAILKTYCNSAAPVILNSPFSYADAIKVKLISAKPKPVFSEDRTQVEGAVVVCMAVDV